MFALLASLTLLLVGYLALTQGPALFSATVMNTVCRRIVADSRRVDETLRGFASFSLDRLRGGDAWTTVESEQSLLDRALETALRLTEIGNQYPSTMDRALAA